jgi:hypothetical protein
MKFYLGIMVLCLLLSKSANAIDIKDFQIEKISIGDSVLGYCSEDQLENSDIAYYLGKD